MSALAPGMLSRLLGHQQRRECGVSRALSLSPFLWAVVPLTVEDNIVPTTPEWVA